MEDDFQPKKSAGQYNLVSLILNSEKSLNNKRKSMRVDDHRKVPRLLFGFRGEAWDDLGIYGKLIIRTAFAVAPASLASLDTADRKLNQINDRLSIELRKA